MLEQAQKAFYQLQELLGETKRVEVYYREYLKRISKSFKARRVSLMLFDETRESLAVEHSQGLTSNIKSNARVKIGQGIAGWVAQKGESLLVKDIDSNKRFKKEKKTKGFRSGSFVCIPIKARKKVYGVLNVSEKTDSKPFSVEDLKALELFGIQLAILVENEKLRQELDALKKKPVQDISKLCHDLLIPVSCIKEAVSLVAEELLGPVSDQQKEFLQIADQNVKRMTVLLDNLTETTRALESEESKTKKTVLTELLEELCRGFQTKAARRNVDLVFSTMLEEARADTEPDRLYEVLMNLVDNALKYSPENGKVSVRLLERGKNYLVEVEDEGPGISEKEGGILFNKEERLKLADKKGKPKGHGLGLAISRDMMRSLGGNISYETVKNKGTVFIVEIPKQLKS